MIDDHKLRILFVGREREEGIEKASSVIADDWDLTFSEDPGKAMESMNSDPFDVIVSEVGMVLGAENVSLLEAVQADFPQAVRIVVTDEPTPDSFVDLVGVAHQRLQKPFDASALEFVVRRASLMQGLVQDPALRYVLADIRSLPVMPSLYLRIVDELSGDDPSIRTVGEIVAQDIAMTAKVLQIANSVVMGTRVEIVDPIQATVQMGADMVKSLVLVAKVFDQFDPGVLGGFALAPLLDHSMRVGMFAQRICKIEKLDREIADAAFTAGLLHDIGKLILAANLPDTYAIASDLARDNEQPIWAAEKDVFGATHAEIGAYLCGLWGLPDHIFNAMLDHHDPRQAASTGLTALTAVHVANAFDHGFIPGETVIEDNDRSLIDMGYIEEIGATQLLEGWRRACFPDA